MVSCANCASKWPEETDLRHIRHKRVGVIVLGSAIAAVLVIGAFGPWAKPSEPATADVYLRALLGVAWVLLQAASLACVYVASAAGFGAICIITATLGMVAMSFGRTGVYGLSGALVACVLATILMFPALGAWFMFRNAHATTAHRVWRLFAWLPSLGAVYLYSAEPGEARA